MDNQCCSLELLMCHWKPLRLNALATQGPAVVRQSAEVLGRRVKAKIIPIRSWPERKKVEILDVDVEERPKTEVSQERYHITPLLVWLRVRRVPGPEASKAPSWT